MLSLILVTCFVTDFGDEAFAHQAAGDERSAVVVHFLQQLLAAIVDEANATEVDQKGRPLIRRFVPAFVQLVNTRARELSLQHEPRVCCFAVTTNSYKFISHAPQPRAICLPQRFHAKTLSSRKDANETKGDLDYSLRALRLCVKLPFVLFCSHRLS